MSVDWIEEKFVIDSQSTDRTIEIAEYLGAKVVQFDYKGDGQRKKLALRKSTFFS